MAKEWAQMFESYDAFAAAHPHGFYLTTFEALTGPASKHQALVGLLHALGVPSDTTTSEACTADGPVMQATTASNSADASRHQSQQDILNPPTQACSAEGPFLGGYDQTRLDCAFQLARHPSIYRPKDPQGVDAAFVYGADKQLVCDVWAVVRAWAVGYGYRPYGQAQC